MRISLNLQDNLLGENEQTLLTKSLSNALEDSTINLNLSQEVSSPKLASNFNQTSREPLQKQQDLVQRQSTQQTNPSASDRAALFTNNSQTKFGQLISRGIVEHLAAKRWRSIQSSSSNSSQNQAERAIQEEPLTEQHLSLCSCYCCQFAELALADLPEEPAVASAQASGGAIPALSSNPNATAKIYLDFNGHVTSDTWWNSKYNDDQDIVTAAYSTDSDKNSFSGSEIAAIEKIWQRVAEDYAPFNVDITTVNPSNFSAREGLRVVVGGSSKDWMGGSAGGIALINSWRWNGDTPVFVFEDQLGNGNAKYTAEAISHEVGHALGLHHQSRYNSSGEQTEAYHSGSGKGVTGWAPIMGTGYTKNLTTWRKGKSSKGSTQDDLAVLASSSNGFGYRSDDRGDTNATATVLTGGTTLSSQGIISTMTDVDVFSFTTGTGDVSFDIDVAPVGANLDAIAELWDGDNLLLKSNPSDKLNANLETYLNAGTYYLHIKNNGQYGRLGQYTVSGTVVEPDSNIPNDNPPDSDGSNSSDNVIAEIGEVGQFKNLTHISQTIVLEKDYINPVVFAQPLSRNGKDPAIVRIDNIESDRFTVSVQEANYKDGRHTTESFSYLVLEAGTWQLADGTLLEVGSFKTNATTTSEWANIDLKAFDKAPVVLSQVQTSNDSDFVRLRQQNISADNFQLALEKEEALETAAHGTEAIGWMALSAGAGDWSGLSYQAGYTGDRMTHRWSSIDFSPNFKKAPQLLASVATYDGGDPVGLRYQQLTSAGVQLMLEEDTSRDRETKHTSENVGFLALEGSGILAAQAYDPLNNQASTAQAIPEPVIGGEPFSSEANSNHQEFDFIQFTQLGNSTDSKLGVSALAFQQPDEEEILGGVDRASLGLDSVSLV